MLDRTLVDLDNARNTIFNYQKEVDRLTTKFQKEKEEIEQNAKLSLEQLRTSLNGVNVEFSKSVLENKKLQELIESKQKQIVELQTQNQKLSEEIKSLELILSQNFG